PRWTDQTKMLVRRHIASAAAAITAAAETDSPYDVSIERATRLLTALADAGVLAEAGESHTEWGVRGVYGTVIPYRDEATARQQYEQRRAWGHEVTLVQRLATDDRPARATL